MASIFPGRRLVAPINVVFDEDSRAPYSFAPPFQFSVEILLGAASPVASVITLSLGPSVDHVGLAVTRSFRSDVGIVNEAVSSCSALLSS